MAGGIHHQYQLASIVCHGDEFATQAGGSQLVKGSHFEILTVKCFCWVIHTIRTYVIHICKVEGGGQETLQFAVMRLVEITES